MSETIKMKNITELYQLEDHQIRYLLRCFTSFFPPKKVASFFLETYGKTIDVDLLVQMHPDVPGGCILDDKQMDYFDERRQTLIRKFPELPIANRLNRLEVLQGLYNHYKKHEDLAKCQELMDLAERETAPVYKHLNNFLSDGKGLQVNSDGWEA